MKIQILVDNKNSWIIPYAEELVAELISLGHDSIMLHRHKDVKSGDILCLLSCERIFKNLHLNSYNLVVHESDLPKGKGWSPLTWQILEGRRDIPITLFEAAESVDSGVIYLQDYIYLDGSELIDEIKHKQGLVTKRLILRFIMEMPEGREQIGESTFYEKRTEKDSELDITKSIADQFRLLQVCDNERYPAYFWMNGTKYLIKIFKDD